MAFFKGKYPIFRIGITAISAVTLIFSSCGVGRTIPKDAHLLKKNTVKVHGPIPVNEISPQILHRSNKRVLFNKVPVYLWAYALGTKHRQPELSDSVKWRNKLRNKLGEPPVLLDTTLVKLSATNIHNYLFNKGFFDAEVGYKIRYTRRKAKVKYQVYPKKPYLINSVFMRAEDSALSGVLYQVAMESDYFRLWWPVDLNKLSEARNYMAVRMRNLGYFTVNPESFRFDVDTSQVKKEGAITMVLENMPGNHPHVKYTWGSCRVRIETSPMYERTKNPVKVYVGNKTLELNRYPINPNTLEQLIYLDSGTLYSQSASEQTYQSLVQMGLFSLIDIRYETDTVKHVIETYVDLKTLPRMAVSIEPQALYSPQGTSGTNFQTTSQRSFGVAGILSYTNKNLAKNAEYLRISSITSYEAILRKDSKSGLLFGLQQGFNASLSLPHFNFLNTIGRTSKIIQRNTVFSLSYQFENNQYFLRSAFPASLTFQFVQPNFSWYYTPTEISFNRNVLSPSYAAQLPEADSVFISRVFTNQFLSAAKVGFIYANNRNKPGETYVFTRAGFETSGNMHHLIRRYERSFKPDSVYGIFGLQYFQYAKLDGEIRLRQNIDELNSVAMRVNTGIVIPYGNSDYVPYDKRYFIGGSNSLRAWRPRRLGPGSTPDTSNLIIDRSGEFLFEGNLEYRFTLVKQLLETALFVDVGNIWNISRPGQTAPYASLLKRNKLFDDLALNTGIGFRFDFTFFLFRVDWGIPLRDPSKALGKRWLLTKQNFIGPGKFIAQETALAFGIGYPF